MKSKDQVLLEEAYLSVKHTQEPVEEGIWDRLKATGAGIKAGAGQLGQNLKAGAIKKLGGTAKAAGK